MLEKLLTKSRKARFKFTSNVLASAGVKVHAQFSEMIGHGSFMRRDIKWEEVPVDATMRDILTDTNEWARANHSKHLARLIADANGDYLEARESVMSDNSSKITTPYELGALPQYAVVREDTGDNRVFEKQGCGNWHSAGEANSEVPELPATVLYTPKETPNA